MIRLNFSGHPQEGWLNIAVGVNVDMIDQAQGAEQLLDLVPHEAIQEMVKGRDYAVIMPGLSGVGAVLLARLHGISGRFPYLAWTYRGEDGFKLSTLVDLDEARRGARELRRYAADL